MKTLLMTLREGSGTESETYVVEGDRRQSTERIIQRGLEELFDEAVEIHDDENNKYRTRDSNRTLTVEETRLLDKDEAESMKSDHFTLVVNENVTENACGVCY